MQVVGVAGDHDVVPVVVVERLVGVPLDEMSTVPQVGHIVQVSGDQNTLRNTYNTSIRPEHTHTLTDLNTHRHIILKYKT